MKKKIVIFAVIAVLLISWLSIAYSDYARVAISFDKLPTVGLMWTDILTKSLVSPLSKAKLIPKRDKEVQA